MAESYAETRALIEAGPDDYFVAVLDLNLPDAPDGEIVDYVLEQKIPVIVLTGTLSDDVRDHMLAKNIVDYVIKKNIGEIVLTASLVHSLQHNHHIKVLIVDDSKLFRDFMCTLLKTHNYHVFEAVDGVQALNVIEANPDIALVITDYNMPNMNGLDLIGNIRQKYDRSEMSIVGISTQGSGPLSAKLLKHGANDFLTRPFLVEEFYCRVTQNIEQIERIRAIRDGATRDYLTGAYNRKHLFEAGQHLYASARRGDIALVAAMVDIDNFKDINDQYGHFFGDLVIKRVASIMLQRIRAADILVRYGGDEFCILATQLDETGAQRLFDDIRKAVETSVISSGGTSVMATISVGITAHLDKDLDHMLIGADRALYQAKEQGRNKVVGH